MAGYTRQSTADIIASAIIKAGPINTEYNALRDAFAFSTGHKHDGSSTEGAYVPLIADPDAKNKVVVDTTNNRISFYSEVSGSAVEQLRIQDGAIVPVTDDDVNLGAVGAEFKDLHIDGIGYIDTIAVHENATIAGTLGVTGVITATGGLVGNVTGNVTGGITGNVTGDLTGDVTSTGTSTFATVDINGGNIDGTVIGATTPAASDFTTMDTTGNASVGGTLGVTGTSTFTGAISAGSLTTTGNSTHATVDINGGAIDGAIIGASSSAAGSFTTVSTSGQATLATADINGGTIDGSVIGGATPQAVTGTTITANTGFAGALTGNVTGNVTGNLTGDVTGDVTGDLTGNVTASSGTTTLNNLVVDGTVDFTSTALLNVSDPTSGQHASTKNYTDTADALKLNLAGGTMSGDITMGGNTVTGLGTPSASSDAATKGYVNTEIAALVDAAPGTLDTLNELAAALGDDPDFATTITDSIATKLPLAGGTMTGDVTLGANKATSTATPATDDTLTRKGYVDTQDALKLNLSGGTMSGVIAMGTSKITGLGDPTATQDAVSKNYSDTQDATKLNLSGGTMTGNIVLGANKATSTATPSAADDLTRKGYVDSIIGSATSSAASAAAASTSETNAATSETNAGNSAAAAAASYNNFDDRYLGAKSSAPSADNDGDALVTGALYWNSSSDELYVWDGSNWQQGSFTAGSLLANVLEDTTPQLGGDLDLNSHDITGTGNVGITGNITLSGTVDGRDVAADGTKLDTIETNADVTDTTNVTASGALMDSEVTNLAQVKAFDSSDYATSTQGTTADSALPKAGGAMTGAITTNSTFDGRDVATDGAKLDNITVTQAVDLDQMEIDIAALANGMVYKGDWDASASTFPGSGSAQIGWFYYVSVAGTVGGVSFSVGDNIVAIADNASTSTYASNWSKHDQTDAVTAVVGLNGSISKSGLLSALNVEDGATADQTNAEIRAAVEAASDSNVFTDADHTKLNAIEAGATADQTAAQILTAVKTVDGSGSGLDADLLDGFNSSTGEGGSTVAVRNASGYLFSSYFNGSGTFSTTGATSGMGRFTGTNGTDTYGRSYTAAAARTLLNVADGATSYTANQALNTTSGPTFSDIFVDNWYRNNQAGEGLYNQATGAHWASSTGTVWVAKNTGTTQKIELQTSGTTRRGSLYADNSNQIGFLDSDDNWAIKHVRDSRTEFLINNVEYMQLEANGLFLHDGSLREDYDALSGTSPTCNVNNGGAFALTMSGNTTFTFTSPVSGYSTGFILEVEGNGSTLTWPSTVDWAGGTAPDAPASGARNLYVFYTRDGGSNWIGVLSSAAYA